EFEASGAGGHSNPPWITCLIQADLASLLDGPNAAIELEKSALGLAKTPEEIGKTLNNLSEFHRHANRYDEAVFFGETAYHITQGTNKGIVLNWAMACYKAGNKDLAEKLIAAVAKVSEINEPGDILGTHLRFEEDLRSMKLPIIKQLNALLN